MPKESGKELEFHRKMAKQCFNETWDFLEKKNRSPADDMQMVHLTHASRYHWKFVGNPGNLAVGDWQISRVYAALKQGELSLLFAKSSLELCVKNKLSELLPSAYEGMARAYAVGRQPELAKDYIARARKELESIRDKEDRKVYGDQINESEALITSGQKNT